LHLHSLVTIAATIAVVLTNYNDVTVESRARVEVGHCQIRMQLLARHVQYLRPHYKAALVSIEDFKQYTQTVVVCADGEVLV